VSLAGDLLARWAPIIRSVELQSAAHGRFEVSLDGDLLFSKASSGRHAKPREIIDLAEKKLGPALLWRKNS